MYAFVGYGKLYKPNFVKEKNRLSAMNTVQINVQ